MKFLATISGFQLLILLVCVPVVLADGKPVMIKFATIAPRGVTDTYERIREFVRQETGGEVDIKVYYGGIQGDEYDALRKIRFKQLSVGAFSLHGMAKMVPEVNVLRLPYLYRNSDESAYIREKLKDRLIPEFAQKGFVFLGWYELGFVYAFSKIPLRSMEVARSQKWWMWDDDPLFQATYDQMKISPIQLSLTDVLTSLSTNMIDAAPAPLNSALAFRWHTRFQYLDEHPISSAVVSMIVTREKWNEISPENQAKMRRIFADETARADAIQRDLNSRSLNVLKKAGISIVNSMETAEVNNQLREAGTRAREALVGKLYSKELLVATLMHLETYRQENPNSKILDLN